MHDPLRGWRERPALALLAWEALARDPLARLRRIQVSQLERQLILGQRLSSIATSQHGAFDQGSPSPSSGRSFSAHLQLFQPDFFQDYL
jgi:hypothetical protein